MYSVDKNKADSQIRLARSYAAKHLPWFGPALFQSRIVLTEAVPVAAIDDNYNVYWNPEVVNLISNSTTDKKRFLEELAFIWIHEISHVLRNHSERAQHINGEHQRWNYAADLEINDSNWTGTRHPTLFPPITPPLYNLPNGKLAEWYYKEISAQNDHIAVWDDGSGCHGAIRPWEISDSGKQEINKLGRIVLQREVARQMRRHLPGHLPGSWGMWVQNTLEPKIDWKKVLQKRLSTAISVGRGSRVDYSYKTPNRRASIFYPFILPKLSGTTDGQLAVVIDTSGSMTGEPINQGVAEIYGILKQVHQKINLIPCDAIDYKPIELTTKEALLKLIQLPGGGGTNMIRGIEAALKLTPIPDTILVLTDGYTPYPSEKYAVPLIWGIIGYASNGFNNLPPKPPWTDDTVVKIDLDYQK